jgi:Zn-dependent peptidase ImmA (M78 family)
MGKSNIDLLHQLKREADHLGESAALGGLPVILRNLAERKRVTAVEFKQLLVDAVLFSHASGFKIALNAGARDPENLLAEYQNEKKDSTMPVRYRFSLAHELAHTLFYDLSSSPPKLAKQFKAGGGKTALDNLEKYCNDLAGHILLPTPLFRNAILSIPKFTPRALLTLAQTAGISLEVLIRRLGFSSALLEEHSYFCGCILLLSGSSQQLNIKALSKPKVRNIARDLRTLSNGEAWQLKDESGILIDIETAPSVSHVVFAGDESLDQRKYSMAVETCSSHRDSTSYVLIFERIALL